MISCGRSDMNEPEDDDELEAFIIEASRAWEDLQCAVWGSRWDYSRPSLDFSRGSLHTLSEWLVRAPAECAAAELLRSAAQYFGETVQEHVLAAWERRDDDTIGLRVRCVDGSARHISLLDVLREWLALQCDDPSATDVFIRHFDAVVIDAMPVRAGRTT